MPKTIASFLSRNSPSVRKAFEREGKTRCIGGVYSRGRNTKFAYWGGAKISGIEARIRHQSFKKYWKFADGGTVENNLLGSISKRPSFKFDGSSLNKKSSNTITRSGTVNINVSTPDADSFRASEHQLGLDAAESLRRSLRR